MPNTLAVLAHPAQISHLIGWLTANQSVVRAFRLMVMAEVAEAIAPIWGGQALEIVALPAAADGGDIALAAHILAGEVAGLLAFFDHGALATAYPSAALLLRACDLRNIPVALNEASASLMLRGMARSQTAYMIFNPVAGQGNPNVDLATIREILEPQIRVNVIMTQPGVDPADQAREIIATIQARTDNDLGHSFIIAAGGDGTVSAVAGATIGTGVPLGIIPRGTANAFSVGLGIPTNLRAACNTIVAGNTHVVDAARCNETPMILLAGLGFEAGMVDKASRELKTNWATWPTCWRG